MSIFKDLVPEQLEFLRDSMGEAPFEEGEVIFEQGDLGDSLYIIISGEVSILLQEQGDYPEIEISHPKQGEYFGERALIRNEPRMATARAATRLQTMYITRADFEHVTGASMETFIPERTKRTDDPELEGGVGSGSGSEDEFPDNNSTGSNIDEGTDDDDEEEDDDDDGIETRGLRCSNASVFSMSKLYR